MRTGLAFARLRARDLSLYLLLLPLSEMQTRDADVRSEMSMACALVQWRYGILI